MPTTVAQLLAARLNRPAVDADDLIELRAEMPIKEIFATSGESGFRNFAMENRPEELWVAKNTPAYRIRFLLTGKAIYENGFVTDSFLFQVPELSRRDRFGIMPTSILATQRMGG